MTTTTGDITPILTQDEVNTVLLGPVEAEAVATQVSTVVRTGAHNYHFPMPTRTDNTSGWLAEGAEIPLSDVKFAELVVTPSKIAKLHVVSREAADDATEEGWDAITGVLVRKIVRDMDAAFFGNLPAPAQPGLGSLEVGVTVDDVQSVNAGAAFSNLDAFAEAQSLAEQANATLTHFVANPTDVLDLATLKVGTGSNQALLGTGGPTAPTQRVIGGVPLVTSPHVPAGTVWGIPQDQVFVVIREDAKVESDSSVLFTSDRVAIKATLRVAYAFPQPSALVRIMKQPA